MRLKDKTAIVTGGAQGIGRMVSRKLAQEGANIVIADINEEVMKETVADIGKIGGKTYGIKTDVSVEREVISMVKETVDIFGRVDILINDAGGRINNPGSFEETTEDDWNRVIAVNLTGTFFCCKAVIPIMKKNGQGKIVNVSSRAGRAGNTTTTVAYASAKAGILGLTRQLACRMGQYGINVNAIAPGYTMSGPKWEKEIWSLVPQDKKERLINGIPLRRLGKPDDQANVIVFLCTEDANYITGACIDVNGGTFMI